MGVLWRHIAGRWIYILVDKASTSIRYIMPNKTLPPVISIARKRTPGVSLANKDRLIDEGDSKRLLHTQPSPECSTVVDKNRNLLEVSDGFCQLVDYSRQELLQMNYDDLTAPGSLDIAAASKLFATVGYMYGLWLLVSRMGTRILVRYESQLRADALVQSHIEAILAIH